MQSGQMGVAAETLLVEGFRDHSYKGEVWRCSVRELCATGNRGFSAMKAGRPQRGGFASAIYYFPYAVLLAMALFAIMFFGSYSLKMQSSSMDAQVIEQFNRLEGDLTAAVDQLGKWAGNELPAAPAPRKDGLVTLNDLEIADDAQWLEKTNALWDANKKLLDEKPWTTQIDEDNKDVTLVSALFDLGRGDLQTEFKRPYQYYIDMFREKFLAYKFPKIIFIEPEHYNSFKDLIDDKTHVVQMTKDELIEIFGGAERRKVLDKTRLRESWFSQAQWLANSPQARMPLYNVLVMSKLFLLRDAARLNPFNTKYFMFIDGAHMCNSPSQIFPQNVDFWREMMEKLVFTYFRYGPAGEIHGFESKPFEQFIGQPFDPKDRYKVVRGGIFGGYRENIEIAAVIYDIILEATLQAEVMGTEENLFSILLYRYPELIHEFSNDDACGESTHYDYRCEGFHNRAGNCALFDWVIHGAPPRNKKPSEW